VLGAAGIISLGVIAGRLAGVVRDVVLAGTLGVGRDADVAVLALSLPDLLTTVLVGGAVSAVLIPDFTLARAEGGSRRLFGAVTIAVGLATGAIALLTALAAPFVVRLLGPGLPADAAALAAPLVALTVAAFPLSALAAVTTGYLQSLGRFAVPAAGTLIFNVTLVVAVALFVRPGDLLWLALGAIAGAALRWLAQLAAALRAPDPAGALPRTVRDLAGLARRYPQALGATSAVVLVPFAGRTIASFGASGDVATLTYALRIVEFPLGAFLTVGAVAALPHLAELVVEHRRDEAVALLGDLLRATTALTVPIATGLVAAAVPVAGLLYGRGAATPDAVAQIGTVAAIALASLPAQGANAAFTSVYVADRRLGVAFAINALGLAAFAVVALVAGDRLGVRGIAVAYTILHWTLALAYSVDLGRARGIAVPVSVFRGLGLAAAVGCAVALPFAAASRLVAGPALLAVAIAGVGSVAGVLAAFAVSYRGAALRRLLR
jgi:putative peptidoglycan lipid II flippase